MTSDAVETRGRLIWRCARNNVQTAACTVFGDALAEGGVRPALAGWAIAIAVVITLAQALTQTCPRWYW